MSKLNNFIKKYKYYIFCFICVLLVLRLVYSRYNYLFVRHEFVFIPNIYIITLNILTFILIAILPQYIRYMNRHYPNRDTIIKTVLRSNPVIKDTILYSVEAYNNVYIYRLVDLDKYLERFKAYVKFKYISATFFQEGMNFCIYLKRRQFKSITFMGFISFISHLSCLFFMVYVVYVEPYYYHRCVYNHVGIVLILAIIYRIIGAWAIQLINQKFDKEMQEIDQEYEKFVREEKEAHEKFVREEKEAHEKFVREDNERVISDLISAMLNRKEKLISQKEQLETCLENEKDKNSAKYKEDSNRLKETNESILLVDSALVDLGEWKSGLMSKEEFKKKWNIK